MPASGRYRVQFATVGAVKIFVFGLVAWVAWTVVLAADPAGGLDAVQDAENILGQSENLRPEVLDLALAAYRRPRPRARSMRERLTIVDYELPSYSKRLWVIDMDSGRLMYEEWVAHGMGSPRGSGGDMERALSFSNDHGTRKSSLGVHRTAETYHGKHGYSLKLDGLEPGINHRARERAIVIHSASYVTADRAEDRLIGRSWGCPAVRPVVAKELIDAIKGGSVVWIYYPDKRWLEGSTFLDRVRSGFAAIGESIEAAQ